MKMNYQENIIKLARETNSTATELQSEMLRFIASHPGFIQIERFLIRGKYGYNPYANHPYYETLVILQEIKEEDISILKLCKNCLVKIEECNCEKSGEEQEYQFIFKMVFERLDHIFQKRLNFVFYGITAERALRTDFRKTTSEDGLRDNKKTDYNIRKLVILRGRIIEDTKIFIVYDFKFIQNQCDISLIEKLWEDKNIYEFEDPLNEPLAQILVDLGKDELERLEQTILTSIQDAYEKELPPPDISNLKKVLGDKFEKIQESVVEWEFFRQFGNEILNESIDTSPELLLPLWNGETTFKGITLSKLESIILRELENKLGMNLITYREYNLSTSLRWEKYFNEKGEEISIKNHWENIPDEDLPIHLLSPTPNDFIETKFEVKIEEGHIIELNLEYISCSELPSSIGWLFSLRKLDLCGMGLNLIPDSIENLVNLEELSLYRNELKTLPHSILKLPKLRKIDINKRTVLETRSLDFKKIILDLEKKGVQVIKLEDSNNF